MDESGDTFFDREARDRLSRAIVAWMAAAQIRKRPLALAAGISRTTLDAILNGTRPPDFESVARLASALHTTTGALIDGQLPPGGQVSMLPGSAAAGTAKPMPEDLRVSLAAAHRRNAVLLRSVASLVEVVVAVPGLPQPAIDQLRHLTSQLQREVDELAS